MLDKKTLQKIKQIGIDVDHNAAFGGKSKGNKHLERVVKIAKFLAHTEGADLALTEAGAYLHDTALPSGNDHRYQFNKNTVIRLLKGIGLSPEEVTAIAECAASHEGTARSRTLEAAIVHDADVIEKTGLLGIIRHTWKLTNSGKLKYDRVTDKDVQTVLEHIEWRRKQLRLASSRKLAARVAVRLSHKKAKEIMMLVAPLAHQGVITEKIAPKVARMVSSAQREKLSDQLGVRYLHHGRA